MRMLLMLAAIGVAPVLYVLLKTISATAELTNWPKKWLRTGALAIALWVASYPLSAIVSYTFGLNSVWQALQRPSPFVDAAMVYPFWIGIILAVQLAFLYLVIDGVRLAFFRVYRSHKQRWLKIQSWIVVSLACVAIVYGLSRVYFDTFTVRTREASLEVSDLPEELDGFRIVQIADLQADPRTGERKIGPYVDRVNQLKPDIILFGGDLVTSGTEFIEQGAAAMGKMSARRGVYACLGDHDHFSDKSLVINSLQKHGVTILDNLATVVPVGSTYVSLTGITNVYRTRPTNGTLDGIERQRLQGPVDILLTHQPSPWLVSFAAERGYNLFLAGHTHGGQIAFPLPGFILTGSSFETNYVSGFYEVGSMLVSVNNGLGLTLAPLRYHAPAEVTLIVLKKRTASVASNN
ncbi:MAG TPA: metallophosphoesterase [Blastocatellia bacterium]|nr:metallophosphoesterase [Blastocatellia bacterium]